jgi:hypothetical protein
LRFEQSSDRQVMCQLTDNDFDAINFTDKIVAEESKQPGDKFLIQPMQSAWKLLNDICMHLN